MGDGFWLMFPGLNVLHLQGSSMYVDSATVQDIATHCTKLTESTIRCPHLADEDVCPLLASCAQLIKLHVVQSLITDVSLLSLATFCPQLAKLSLEHCSLLSEGGLISIARGCASLKIIS
eukprot:GDKK01034490.1.p1 GENE.GDKK01034490.1~~GDKK01034490.1.p1  ORF type:complete len:120 (+),score=0.21 GDKK01034490.1:1-360(+)